MTKIDFEARNYYLVTSESGGSVEVAVLLRDIVDMGERQAVANAAWRKLFTAPKINAEWGQDRGNAHKMLQCMCDRFGTDRVKRVFTAKIVFDRQRRRM